MIGRSASRSGTMSARGGRAKFVSGTPSPSPACASEIALHLTNLMCTTVSLTDQAPRQTRPGPRVKRVTGNPANTADGIRATRLAIRPRSLPVSNDAPAPLPLFGAHFCACPPSAPVLPSSRPSAMFRQRGGQSLADVPNGAQRASADSRSAVNTPVDARTTDPPPVAISRLHLGDRRIPDHRSADDAPATVAARRRSRPPSVPGSPAPHWSLADS